MSRDGQDPVEAWLLAREQGHAAPPPDPDDARAYDELGRALQGLPTLKPPALTLARVRAALDAATVPARPPARRRRWPVAIAALAAAAALLLVWLALGSRDGGGDGPVAELTVGLRRGDAIRRATDPATVGDVVTARVRLEGPGELRLYRGEHTLVVRCLGEPGCRQRDDGNARELTLEVALDAPGRYRVVALIGGRTDPPGGEPTGSLDEDLRLARATGARVVVAPTIDVH